MKKGNFETQNVANQEVVFTSQAETKEETGTGLGSNKKRIAAGSPGQALRILCLGVDFERRCLIRVFCELYDYLVLDAENIAEAHKVLEQDKPQVIVVAAKLCSTKESLGFLHRAESAYKIAIGPYLKHSLTEIAEFDFCLKEPLNIRQLDQGLRAILQTPHFRFQDRRTGERRSGRERRTAANDRRQSESLIECDADQATEVPVKIGLCQIYDREKRVILNDRELELTCKEYQLFVLLASDLGRVFSNELIIRNVWGNNSHATNSDVYQCVHLLRKKIEDNPKRPCWLLSVAGFGYKLSSQKNIQLVDPVRT